MPSGIKKYEDKATAGRAVLSLRYLFAFGMGRARHLGMRKPWAKNTQGLLSFAKPLQDNQFLGGQGQIFAAVGG